MAWRSSGNSNDEMVDNLKRFGVVRNEHIEAAFRAVDRRFFVPQTQQSLSHTDQPLREGHVHISAPHIYGCILEALDLTPNSSLSFLNIGSGTGYLSSIVAETIGHTGVCYGVELQKDAIDHCMASMERWKASRTDTSHLPHIEFFHGNGLEIIPNRGEANLGFDRIYVGASIDKSRLCRIASLLRPGGVLVSPVEDELVKVIRHRSSVPQQQTPVRSTIPRSFRGRPPVLSEDFSQQVISAVHFARLSNNPSIPTIIPSRVWTPSIHHYYPESFRKSCREILLCNQASMHQPKPIIPVDTINVASQLPRDLWVKVLSYAHRDWFEQPLSEENLLRKQLQEEQSALQRAREARLEAENRLRQVERERDGYRLLALRWRSRLQVLLDQRSGSNNGTNDELLEQEDISQAAAAVFRNDPVIIRLGGINAIIRHFQDDDDSNDEAEESHQDVDEQVDDMEADSEDEDTSDNDMDDASETPTEVMLSETTAAAGINFRPARAVSIVSGGNP